MRHFSLKKLLPALCLLCGFALSAQTPGEFYEQPDYSMKFTASNVSSSKFVAPEGWDHFVQGTPVSYSSTTNGTAGYGIGTSNTQQDGSYDLLVTPQVKGTLSFIVRRYVYSAAFKLDIRFYKLTKTDDGFTFDPETDRIPYELPDDLKPENQSTITTWSDTQTIDLGDEYTYVGVRVSEGYIGNFGATSANIYVPIKKSITLGTASYLEGYTYEVSATPDGKWAMGVKAYVNNTSNVPLLADQEENFTISLVRVISTNNPYEYEVLKTVPMPDLALDATEEIVIEDIFDIPDMAADSNGRLRFRLDVVENFSGQSKSLSGSWCEIIPYASVLEIRYDKKDNYNGAVTETTVDPTKTPISYGVFATQRAMDFKLRNRGAADLIVESVEAPEWISIEDFELPVTVAPGESKTISVKVAGEPGFKQGEIKFNTNGLAIVNTIPVMAEVVGENEFFADFESYTALDEWYVPAASTNWKVDVYTSSERNANDNYYPLEYGFNGKRLENGYQTAPQYIYSPKLAFAENEPFVFYAAKKSNSGSDIRLEVKYSTDRANWTELGTILVTNNGNEDLQFSSGTSSSTTSGGQNIFKRFTFTMPEGEYYISLGGSYVLVDNFHGGTKVDVDYDIVSETAAVGATTIVNHDLTYTTSFKNLLDAEIPADDQTVTLYVDGQPVATAEAQTLEGNATVNYEISYMPHEAGTVEIYAEIAIGEYSVTSPVVTVKVEAESATMKNTIGEAKSTSSNVPLTLNYVNSRSEVVYTSELLGGMSGNILKISYPYYKTSSEQTNQTFNIWLENTEETAVGGTLTDTYADDCTMTLVYHSDAYTIKKEGSSINDYAEMEFILDTPFEYTGGNLRVVIEKRAAPGQYAQCTFVVDNRSGYTTRYYYNDTESTYLSNYNGTGSTFTGFPMVNFFTEQEVPAATGTVVDEEGTPVANALVKAQAVDSEVYYETTTDNEGAWTISIFQSEFEYTVTASLEGYTSPEPMALDLEAANEIILEEEIVHPVNGAFTYTKVETDEPESEELYDVVLTWDMGEYEVEDEFRGYTFAVSLNDEPHGTTSTTSYTLTNLPVGNHQAVVNATTASGKAANPLTIEVNLEDTTGISAVEAAQGNWKYYDLRGLEVNAENISSGIYIRVSGTTVQKVRVVE